MIDTTLKKKQAKLCSREERGRRALAICYPHNCATDIESLCSKGRDQASAPRGEDAAREASASAATASSADSSRSTSSTSTPEEGARSAAHEPPALSVRSSSVLVF